MCFKKTVYVILIDGYEPLLGGTRQTIQFIRGGGGTVPTTTMFYLYSLNLCGSWM